MYQCDIHGSIGIWRRVCQASSCLSQGTDLKEVAADVGQRCNPEKGPSKPSKAAGQHVAAVGVPIQTPRIDALPEPQRPVPPAMQGEYGHRPMPQPPAVRRSKEGQQ